MDPARIEQLRDPEIYPGRPDRVEIVQTHLSVVVLAGDRAYKFKKSVRFPFADFTSVEHRRELCEEEVRLNRRLCPEIYEGVVEFRSDESGRLRIGEGRDCFDFAVKMRRMPQDRMMDVLLERDEVNRDEVVAVARRVLAFHETADRGPEIAAWGDPMSLRDFALANFAETREFFPGELHPVLERRTRGDFERILPRMRERAAAGFVIDGHGDLHARNICLLDPPAIYDCIEFCDAFRCGDVATEHAFLLMDLRYRGHPELARVYRETILAGSGDRSMEPLLPTLIRYRAMVRAKVSALVSGEGEIPPGERAEAVETARRYLCLAAASAVEDGAPRWILCCGLPASGKSGVAAALAKSSGGSWPVLSSDRLRKELAGFAPTAMLPPEFYDSAFSRRTYDELLARALAAPGRAESRPDAVVVLDANFRSREERSRFREAARGAGIRFDLVHVELDEAIALERLRSRAAAGDSESDADAAVYARLKDSFEPPEEGEADRLVRISGDLAPEEAAGRVMAGLIA